MRRRLGDRPDDRTVRAVAKDGYELPKAQATERTANVQMGPGETADFELRPMRPGEYAEPSTGMFA